MFIEGYGNVYVGVGFAQEPAGTWSWDSIPADMVFKTCQIGESTPVEKMRLTSNGNLGIGTTLPTSTIDVRGSIKSYSYTPIGLTIPAHGIYSPSGNNIAFSTNLTSRLIISDNGYVGIGTTMPADSLHVQGNTIIGGNFAVNGNIVGQITFTGSVTLPANTSYSGGATFPGNVTAPAFVPTGNIAPNFGMYSPRNNNVAISANAAPVMLVDTSGVHVTGIIQTSGYTVAKLPAAGVAGRRAYVTDALNPVYLSAVVGAGTVVCPVFDNGTTWVVA